MTEEAKEAEARLVAQAKGFYDEFLIFRFRATNVEPFPFESVNFEQTWLNYGAALVRISREYDQRF